MENNKIGLILGDAGDSGVASMVFKTFEEAVDYVEKALNRKGTAGVHGGGRKMSWDLEHDDFDEAIYNFFESYYDGCGECHGIDVIEVGFGEIIQGFSLD